MDGLFDRAVPFGRELRVDPFRMIYDVVEAEATVKIIAIGYKEGNRLFIHGEEYQL